MFFYFPHIFLLLPIFHFYGNVDAIQGCAGFGWTLVNGECHKPFTYFVNQQQANELCKKVGAQMVSFLSQANGEMAKLASEEMKMLTMINPPANLASGKQNGVICKRAAVEKAALTAADTGCPDAPLKIQLKSESAASSGQRSSSSASSSSSSSFGQRASSSSKRGESRHSGGYGVDQNNLVINIYGEEERGGRGSRKYLNQRNKFGNNRRGMYEEFEESKNQRGKKNEFGGEEDEEEILIRREITKNGNGGGKGNGRGGRMEVEMKKGKKNADANSKSAAKMSESESESEDEESSNASSSSSSSSKREEEASSSKFAAQNSKSSSSHSSSSSSSSSSSKSEKFEEKEEMVEESEIEEKK